MLPEIKGMRVFSRGSAAAAPKAEISVGGTAEPWMGCKNTSPVLAKFDVESLWLADCSLVDQRTKPLCCCADYMVITDE